LGVAARKRIEPDLGTLFRKEKGKFADVTSKAEYASTRNEVDE